MITRAICPDTDVLVSFLYGEFDGSEAFDRRTIAKHLEACDRCAREVASLAGVRDTLREWAAPEMALGFRVVHDPPRRPSWLPAWSMPALPLAAAAVLVLAAAIGLARFDIQYDAQGLRIRTGWGHATVPTAAESARSLSASGAGAASAGLVPSSGASSARAAVRPSINAAGVPVDAPWRAELVALERQFRQELAALRQGDRVSATNVVAGDPSRPLSSAADQALLRRVQDMIDQSEVRQQQNLALRAAELSRDFDLQRRSDLVRIEQGFGKLNDQRAQDVEAQRQILNAIRVSQQQPQR
jgi:hypothetical protein